MTNETTMTRDEMTAKMVEIRAQVEKDCLEYNNLFQTEKYKEAFQLEAEMDKKIKAYKKYANLICFEECKNADDPMLEAVKRLNFVTIAAKDFHEKDDRGSDWKIRRIIEKEVIINLLDLDRYCDGIGKDKNWQYICQKMNFLLTAKKAVELGINPKMVNDSYAMSEIAKKIEMGKTPTSKTQLLNQLRAVVTAMIGEEYKPVSHDVNYLLSIYCRKSRNALMVSCANHKNFRRYITEICHRIVTGKSYQLDFIKNKQQ